MGIWKDWVVKHLVIKLIIITVGALIVISYVHYQNQSYNSQEKYLTGTWQSSDGAFTVSFYSDNTCLMINDTISLSGTWEYTPQINWIDICWEGYEHNISCHFTNEGKDLGYGCMFDCTGSKLLVKLDE